MDDGSFAAGLHLAQRLRHGDQPDQHRHQWDAAVEIDDAEGEARHAGGGVEADEVDAEPADRGNEPLEERASRRRGDDGEGDDGDGGVLDRPELQRRSAEETSELQSLLRISYDVFCLKKKKRANTKTNKQTQHRY